MQRHFHARKRPRRVGAAVHFTNVPRVRWRMGCNPLRRRADSLSPTSAASFGTPYRLPVRQRLPVLGLLLVPKNESADKTDNAGFSAWALFVRAGDSASACVLNPEKKEVHPK
jgi:hypothetical protein